MYRTSTIGVVRRDHIRVPFEHGRTTVRALVENLESAGGRVWLDQDLTGGEAWWSAILNQIRDCSVFVFALSENSLNSEACLLELKHARDLGRAILPVQIGDCPGCATTSSSATSRSTTGNPPHQPASPWPVPCTSANRTCRRCPIRCPTRRRFRTST